MAMLDLLKLVLCRRLQHAMSHGPIGALIQEALPFDSAPFLKAQVIK